MATAKHVQEHQKILDDHEKELKEVGSPAEKQTTDEQVDKDRKSESGEKEKDLEYYKHRLNVVLGKYNAEITRANKELNGYKDRVAELEDQIKVLTATPKESLFSEEDKERYGDDYTQLIEKGIEKSRKEDQETINQLKNELKNLQQVKTPQQEVVSGPRAEFMQILKDKVPNWEEVNASEGFNLFLETKDNLSGDTYRDLIRRADQKLDVDRVIYFFQTYLNTQKPGMQHKSGTYMPEKRVSSDSSQEGYITRREIDEFYQSVRRGTYQGDASAMEIKIAKAQRDGKII